jgi:hypothetical protein
LLADTRTFVSDSQASFETADGFHGEVSVGGSTAATPAAQPQQWQLQEQQLAGVVLQRWLAPMMPDMSYWSSKVQSLATQAVVSGHLPKRRSSDGCVPSALSRPRDDRESFIATASGV